MAKKTLTEAVFITNRLGELRQRLELVSSAWTVDNYQALLNFYVDILPSVMGVERCTVYLSEIGTEKICSIYGTGLEGKQIKPPRSGSMVGKVISTGEAIVENDLNGRTGYHTQVAEKVRYVTKNMACVPIKSVTGYGVTGAIQVLNKLGGGHFDEQDLRLLEQVANYLSMSIESIILNREILRISGQLNWEVEQFYKGYFVDTLFIAESPAMRELLDQVRLVSTSPVNVLIEGENGTGKELIARMLHEGSDRRDKPFVAVNCASIPENLMESEFFGYEKGAFTGADRSRAGRFEEADGGTLFLDEIADMPLNIQPKFLRAIQEGEGSRLGSNKVVNYDLRIISATNKDLKQEVADERFREDLFFRLFSVELFLPPLRDRREDIVPLAIAFLEDVSKSFSKTVAGFSPEVLNLFEAFHWPGNVRQLRKEVERLVTLTPPGDYITPNRCSRDLLDYAGKAKVAAPVAFSAGLSIPEQVRALEISLIEKALEKTGGNRVKAAELLEITRQGLHKKLKRYQIEV